MNFFMMSLFTVYILINLFEMGDANLDMENKSLLKVCIMWHWQNYLKILEGIE